MNIIPSPALAGEVFAGIPGCTVALDAVGLTHGDGAIVEAVVQSLREGQDVLDFHLGREQHAGADLHAAIGAFAVGGVKAKLLPQYPFLNIGAANALWGAAYDRGGFGADAFIALLVRRLALLLFLLLLAALLQVAG